MISRMCLLAIGLCPVTFLSTNACTLNEIQKADMRAGICRGAVGVVSRPGCTRLLIKSQVEDQFKEIALARRCGYEAEADKLENFYSQTTPIVVKLYECVDQPIDQAAIERSAKQDTDKNLAGLPQGCSGELKAQLAKRLPKEIAADEKSLADLKLIASQAGLAK